MAQTLPGNVAPPEGSEITPKAEPQHKPDAANDSKVKANGASGADDDGDGDDLGKVSLTQKELQQLIDASVERAAGKIRKANQDLADKNAKLNEAKRNLIERLQGYEQQQEELALQEARKTNNWETVLENERKQSRSKLDELTAERDQYRTENHGIIVGQALQSAFDAANIAPHLRPLIYNYFSAQAQVVEDPGSPLFGKSAQIDGIPVADVVAAWAQSDQGASFVLVPRNGAGGPPTAGTGGGGGAKAVKAYPPRREMGIEQKVKLIQEIGSDEFLRLPF